MDMNIILGIVFIIMSCFEYVVAKFIMPKAFQSRRDQGLPVDEKQAALVIRMLTIFTYAAFFGGLALIIFQPFNLPPFILSRS